MKKYYIEGIVLLQLFLNFLKQISALLSISGVTAARTRIKVSKQEPQFLYYPQNSSSSIFIKLLMIFLKLSERIKMGFVHLSSATIYLCQYTFYKKSQNPGSDPNEKCAECQELHLCNIIVTIFIYLFFHF